MWYDFEIGSFVMLIAIEQHCFEIQIRRIYIYRFKCEGVSSKKGQYFNFISSDFH